MMKESIREKIRRVRSSNNVWNDIGRGKDGRIGYGRMEWGMGKCTEDEMRVKGSEIKR